MNRQRKYFKSTLALSMLVVFIFPIIVSAFHIHNSEELSSHQLDHSDLHSFDVMLFWGSLRENINTRIKEFKK